MIERVEESKKIFIDENGVRYMDGRDGYFSDNDKYFHAYIDGSDGFDIIGEYLYNVKTGKCLEKIY